MIPPGAQQESALKAGNAWLAQSGRTALEFQHEAWRAYLRGESVLINAPTAGFDANELLAFALWRREHFGIAVEVIAGNHDRRERREKWSGLAAWHASPLVEPPFVFAHEPAAHPGGYVLAGHIHPVLRITARSHRLRVPVFWQRPEILVLPSFASLTGGANISPQPADRLFAAGPERVIPLSARSYR